MDNKFRSLFHDLFRKLIIDNNIRGKDLISLCLTDKLLSEKCIYRDEDIFKYLLAEDFDFDFSRFRGYSAYSIYKSLYMTELMMKIGSNGLDTMVAIINGNNLKVHKLEYEKDKDDVEILEVEPDVGQLLKNYNNVKRFILNKQILKSIFFPDEFYKLLELGSALVELTNDTYVHIISESVVAFKTPDNDKIRQFYSYYGNSTVPYSYAIIHAM